MSARIFPINSIPKSIVCQIATALIGLLSSCGSSQSNRVINVVKTSGYQQNFGPFDSNGNYVEKWADHPPKRRYITKGSKKKSKRVATTPPKPRYVTKKTPARAQVVPTPKPTNRPKAKTITKRTTAKSTKKRATKRASTVVKPKKRPPVTHAVKRGDTLYSLSRKYRTTVGSIQRANKLKGTNIGLGQHLIIPRK